MRLERGLQTLPEVDVLHWLLVGAFGVAFLTGLRIATEAPDRSWINLFDAVLPRGSVWVPHMQAALVLAASVTVLIVLAISPAGQVLRRDLLTQWDVVRYWISGLF